MKFEFQEIQPSTPAFLLPCGMIAVIKQPPGDGLSRIFENAEKNLTPVLLQSIEQLGEHKAGEVTEEMFESLPSADGNMLTFMFIMLVNGFPKEYEGYFSFPREKTDKKDHKEQFSQSLKLEDIPFALSYPASVLLLKALNEKLQAEAPKGAKFEPLEELPPVDEILKKHPDICLKTVSEVNESCQFEATLPTGKQITFAIPGQAREQKVEEWLQSPTGKKANDLDIALKTYSFRIAPDESFPQGRELHSKHLQNNQDTLAVLSVTKSLKGKFKISIEMAHPESGNRYSVTLFQLPDFLVQPDFLSKPGTAS